MSSEKSSEIILHWLRQKPTMSAKELAEIMGMTSRAVEKQIAVLRKRGFLKRVGSPRTGVWRVIEKDS